MEITAIVHDLEECTDARIHQMLEKFPDIILREVMSFMNPAEWCMLAMSSKSLAAAVVALSEQSIAAFLPPHLLPTKVATKKPVMTGSLDQLRELDQPDKSWTFTYHSISFPPVFSLNWGPNMKVYQQLVSIDVSGTWAVNGTYTNGDRYCYLMKLQQIGPRRGVARLEVYVEGEVQQEDTEQVMVIGGKVDSNIAIFHEIMLQQHDPESSNVASAVIDISTGRFMSGAWLQHETHVSRGSVDCNLLMRRDQQIRHHYPLRVLCSGCFTAMKDAAAF